MAAVLTMTARQTLQYLSRKNRTNQNIADVALRSEYWLQDTKVSRYALYLGAGYHYWGRDIQPSSDVNGNPVGGLFEAYTWWSGFLGAKAALYESGTSHWLLDARLMQIINPTMDVRFSGYDSVKLTLGERPGLRVSLPWLYTMNRSSSLNVEPFGRNLRAWPQRKHTSHHQWQPNRPASLRTPEQNQKLRLKHRNQKEFLTRT